MQRFASLVELYGSLLDGLPPEAEADLVEELRVFLPARPPGTSSGHELMLSELSTVVLGLRARLEARWSWASWTDEDVERERSSRKQLVE